MCREYRSCCSDFEQRTPTQHLDTELWTQKPGYRKRLTMEKSPEVPTYCQAYTQFVEEVICWYTRDLLRWSLHLRRRRDCTSHDLSSPTSNYQQVNVSMSIACRYMSSISERHLSVRGQIQAAAGRLPIIPAILNSIQENIGSLSTMLGPHHLVAETVWLYIPNQFYSFQRH